MTLELTRPSEYLQLVDSTKGTVDRRIYSEQAIYEAELEQIFARCWNFVAHESQLPNPGDFFMTNIGEDRVIAVRDKQGTVQALLNTCRHRGNAVCRAEEGHATSFMCTYHGWTYDLQGKLVGVPGFKDYYHEDLNREEWGLVRARTESYKGFVFACLDETAPPLDEFLGDVGKMGIDQLVARGDTMVVGGVQKYTIQCNWKFAVDNVWDYYHAGITHASAGMAGWRGGVVAPRVPQVNRTPNSMYTSVIGYYGHTVGGPSFDPNSNYNNLRLGTAREGWREDPETKQVLGAVGLRANGHPHIFPNLWFMNGFEKISLRIPKGPTTTEIWWFGFYNPDASPEEIAASAIRMSRHDGPAGMFEQEDGENWGESTRGSKGTVSKRYPVNYSMNVGKGEVIDDETGPPRIDTTNNEHSQLWFYESWTKWMAAQSWSELNSMQSIPDVR